MLIFFRENKNILTYSILSQHQDGTGSRNPSLWKTRTLSFCKVSTMVAVDLATLGVISNDGIDQTIAEYLGYNFSTKVNHIAMAYCKRDVTPLLMHWSCASFALTHWGRVTHIWVGKLAIIGLDNGLSPGWCQAIIQTNDGILLIETIGTYFSEIWSEIHTFSFKKMHLKLSSAKWRPFCLGLNVLRHPYVNHGTAIRSSELFLLSNFYMILYMYFVLAHLNAIL